MVQAIEEALQTAVSQVEHPEFEDRNLGELGMIQEVMFVDEHVNVTLVLPFPNVSLKEKLVALIREEVAKVDRQLAI